jgi:predicted MPP superfamily phosphohydrolase
VFKNIKTILISIIIAGIIFFIIEIFFRVYFSEFNNRVLEGYDQQGLVQNKYQFFKIIKSQKGETRIRDPKFIKNKNNDFYVAIIGDSVTAGYGLAYNNTFYYIAENLLNKINLKTNIVAYGSNGSDLREELIKFNNYYENSDDYKKKILIYQFAYNDLTAQYLYGFEKGFEYFGPNEMSKLNKAIAMKTMAFRYKYLNRSTFLSWLQFQMGKLRWKVSEKDCLKRGVYALGELTYAYQAKGFELDSKKVWSGFEKDLQSLKNFAAKNNFELYVLILPTSLQLMDHEENNMYNYDTKCSTVEARENILKTLEKFSIKYIDPLPALNEYVQQQKNENNKQKLFFDLDIMHPNELGNRIIGEQFFYTLYRNFSEKK